MFHAIMSPVAPRGFVIVSAAAGGLLKEREVKEIRCLSCIDVGDTECGVTDSAMDTKR
jgi:hypothetical protein